MRWALTVWGGSVGAGCLLVGGCRLRGELAVGGACGGCARSRRIGLFSGTAWGVKLKLIEFFKSEVGGWKRWEVAWLIIATLIILGLSLYWHDGILSLGAALTGVWCVILTGKGKRSSFILGLFNVVLYSIISWQAKYYGEVMLNMLYYLPMNFVGWFMWNKHMNKATGEVIKTKLPLKRAFLIYVVTALVIVGYGWFLEQLGGNLPYMDSMSTVISVTAQLLSVWRLTEQWILWIFVDIITIIMWAINFVNERETIAMLAMWSVFLVNAIFMYIRWNKEATSSCVSQ